MPRPRGRRNLGALEEQTKGLCAKSAGGIGGDLCPNCFSVKSSFISKTSCGILKHSQGPFTTTVPFVL